MDSFGKWRKWKLIYFVVNAESYRVVWTIIAMLTIRSDMLPFSVNNQNIKIFGVLPEHCITICHSKQLQEGHLMVFSDDFLHFLKPRKNLLNSPKLFCGFKGTANPILTELPGSVAKGAIQICGVIRIMTCQLPFNWNQGNRMAQYMKWQ